MEGLADNGNQAAALAIADRLTTAQLTTLTTYGSFYLQVCDGRYFASSMEAQTASHSQRSDR